MREPDEIDVEINVIQPAARSAEVISSRADITAGWASWHAPLPPPEVLQRYEGILPGAANRILEMTDSQHKRRHSMERTVIVGDSRRAYLGLVAGFVIPVLVIVGGVSLIATNHEWAGGVLIGINLTGLVGVFAYGSKARRYERNRHSETTSE